MDTISYSPDGITGLSMPRIRVMEYPYKVIRIEPSNRLQANRSYVDIINVVYSLYKDFREMESTNSVSFLKID